MWKVGIKRGAFLHSRGVWGCCYFETRVALCTLQMMSSFLKGSVSPEGSFVPAVWCFYVSSEIVLLCSSLGCHCYKRISEWLLAQHLFLCCQQCNQAPFEMSLMLRRIFKTISCAISTIIWEQLKKYCASSKGSVVLHTHVLAPLCGEKNPLASYS